MELWVLIFCLWGGIQLKGKTHKLASWEERNRMEKINDKWRWLVDSTKHQQHAGNIQVKLIDANEKPQRSCYRVNFNIFFLSAKELELRSLLTVNSNRWWCHCSFSQKFQVFLLKRPQQIKNANWVSIFRIYLNFTNSCKRVCIDEMMNMQQKIIWSKLHYNIWSYNAEKSDVSPRAMLEIDEFITKI